MPFALRMTIGVVIWAKYEIIGNSKVILELRPNLIFGSIAIILMEIKALFGDQLRITASTSSIISTEKICMNRINQS